MFAVVKLFDIKSKYIVVPINWIHKFSSAHLLNYGISQQKKFVVFYSQTKNREPVFGHNVHVSPLSELARHIEQNIDGYYLGCIDCIFRK